MNSTFDTTWHINGDAALSPDLAAEPAPPDGFYRSAARWDTPEEVAEGDPVTVSLAYTKLPPPPPEPESAPEPQS